MKKLRRAAHRPPKTDLLGLRSAFIARVSQPFHVSGEPFPDLPDAEFSFADRFCDELVRRESFDFQIMAVDTQKCVRRRDTDSLVAVEEGMVIGERFHQRGGAPGNALEDWTRAERELLENGSKPRRKPAPKSIAA